MKATLLECHSDNKQPPFLSLRMNPNYGSAEVTTYFRQAEASLVQNLTKIFTKEYIDIWDTFLAENEAESMAVYTELKAKTSKGPELEALKRDVKQAVKEGKTEAE